MSNSTFRALPPGSMRACHLVKLLREPRRRRLEATEEPFDDLPESFDCTRRAPQSISEILRSRYARRRENSPEIRFRPADGTDDFTFAVHLHQFPGFGQANENS